MPKKRTVEPYYGKKCQRLNTLGTKAMQRGDTETASGLFTAAAMDHAKRAIAAGAGRTAERIIRRHERAQGVSR